MLRNPASWRRYITDKFDTIPQSMHGKLSVHDNPALLLVAVTLFVAGAIVFHVAHSLWMYPTAFFALALICLFFKHPLWKTGYDLFVTLSLLAIGLVIISTAVHVA